MAPTSRLLVRQAAASGGEMESPVFASAIGLATLSFFMVLLIVPPMCWHLRNRNLGASMLVAWVAILNLQSFVNSLLWSNDDMGRWYNGKGLCDVEVKVQVAAQVALPAATCCILRALAEVMDTNRATLVKTQAQRQMRHAVDLLFCLGFPVLQMPLHYIVQPSRYDLYGIAGCVPTTAVSWMTIVLIYVPPMVWTIVDAYYAILIVVRLYHYRLAFVSLLATSNIPKSRFMRLYILCLVWFIGLVPMSAYFLYYNFNNTLGQLNQYNWATVHDAATWNTIRMVGSGGTIVYDRYIWLVEAGLIFVFFGFGKEAVSMYRSGLLALGFGRIFPLLDPEHVRRHSVSGTVSSFGSKAKLLFKRKSSASSYTDSSTSRMVSATDPLSPKNVTFFGAVNEDNQTKEKFPLTATIIHTAPQGHMLDSEKLNAFTEHRAAWKRFVPPLRVRKSSTADEQVLTSLSGQPATIKSDISSNEVSPTLSEHQSSVGPCEVIVRREVRQQSETADTLPAVAYHAA